MVREAGRSLDSSAYLSRPAQTTGRDAQQSEMKVDSSGARDGRVRELAGSPSRMQSPLAVSDRLSERVAAWIRDSILSGELRPGDRLNEAGIAEALRVSKSPVREAIRQLDSEGLILASPRRGAYVRGMSKGDARDLRVVRLALETLAVRLAMKRAEAQWVDSLEVAAREIGRARSRAELSELHLSFHDVLTGSSQNAFLGDAMARLRSQTAVLMPFVDLLSGSAAAEVDEHMAIVVAIRSGQTGLAARVLDHHITGTGKLLESRWSGGRQENQTKRPPDRTAAAHRRADSLVTERSAGGKPSAARASTTSAPLTPASRSERARARAASSDEAEVGPQP
jgi:DNA-binding GntR family transcriptional regulator